MFGRVGTINGTATLLYSSSRWRWSRSMNLRKDIQVTCIYNSPWQANEEDSSWGIANLDECT